MGLESVSPVGRLNTQKRSSHSNERKSTWLSSRPTFTLPTLATSSVNPVGKGREAQETDAQRRGHLLHSLPAAPSQSHPHLLKLFFLSTHMTHKYLHKFC